MKVKELKEILAECNDEWELCATDVCEKGIGLNNAYINGGNLCLTTSQAFPDDWYDENGEEIKDEDYYREELRHQISPLLNGTSEENPLDVSFVLPSTFSDRFPKVMSGLFEMVGEGTMWYQLEQDLRTDTWHDLDELCIDDLRGLLDYLRWYDARFNHGTK